MPSSVTSSVISATLVGVDGHLVTVEVHVGQGLPGYQVVGLPDAAVRESRERVRAALLSSELTWPQKRVTVNLAPGGLRKTGSGFELAVALGIAVANEELPAGVLDGVAVLGELGLDGSVRAVPGTLALVDVLTRAGASAVIVPIANAAEAALVNGVQVRAASHLAVLRSCLKDETTWPDWPAPAAPDESTDEAVDLAEVRGLAWARRRARGRRRRRPPPAAHRPARRGQDHARPPARHDPPATHPRRSPRSHAHPFRRRARTRRWPRTYPPVPGPAPHRVDRRTRRRREPAPRPR